MVSKRIRVALATTILIGAVAGCGGNDLPSDAAPETILEHSEGLLAREKFFDAAELLEHYVRTYPGSASMPLAKLRLGDARFGLEEYVRAKGHYEDVAQDYAASPYVEEARYKIGLCAYESTLPYNLDQTETERAIRLFEEFRRDYPGSRWDAEVVAALRDCNDRLAHREYEAGRFYERQARYRSAKIQYEYVLDNHPGTAWAKKSLYRLAGVFAAKEKWAEAAEIYRRVLRESPDSEEAELAKEALSRIEALSGVVAPEPSP